MVSSVTLNFELQKSMSSIARFCWKLFSVGESRSRSVYSRDFISVPAKGSPGAEEDCRTSASTSCSLARFRSPFHTLSLSAGRLTWLVYIIGAVIGGRVSFASTDEQDAMDGELVCRVLQLMNLTDSRLAQAGNEKLELSMLSFFEQFRKIYIGDQVQKSSK
ncbi:hypothetical protein FKM82_027159, partial [Ascaphus truei]